MKKLFYFLSLTCMVALLAACGNKSKSDKDDEAFVPQKGDIKVIVEMDEGDILLSLADVYSHDASFLKAIDEARIEDRFQDEASFIDCFFQSWKKFAGERSLSSIFANAVMRDKVNVNSSDQEVLSALKEEIQVALDNTEYVLNSRLDKADICPYSIERMEGSKPRMVVYARCDGEDRDRLFRLLAAKSQLEFWETYNGDEIFPTLKNILDNYAQETEEETIAPPDSLNELDRAIYEHDQELKAHSRGLMLTQYASPVVGIASVHDTAEVNRIIQSDQAQQLLRGLPWETRLVWGAKAADMNRYATEADEVVELYALKITEPSGCAPIDGSVITSAEAGFNNNVPIVSLQMNASGTRLWADFTRKNLRRGVAVVVDDVVYTAPTIQTEITGGQSQISGNFTVEETKDLANIISSGRLPAHVRIISYEVLEE